MRSRRHEWRSGALAGAMETHHLPLPCSLDHVLCERETDKKKGPIIDLMVQMELQNITRTAVQTKMS
eukprot:2113546-Amphidinium_carterae.1